MDQAISWFEIPVHDFDRAVQFYESIFSWELRRENFGPELKMAIFPQTEGAGGALVWNTRFYQPSESGPLVYLNANPDLEVVESRVPDAGGEVLISKRMISPEHGFMAVIRDSEGNRIALHSDN